MNLDLRIWITNSKFRIPNSELLPSRRKPVGFLFNGFDHVLEAVDVCRRDAPRNGALEIDQVIQHLTRDLPALAVSVMTNVRRSDTPASLVMKPRSARRSRMLVSVDRLCARP